MTNTQQVPPDSPLPTSWERSYAVGLVAALGAMTVYDLVGTQWVLGELPLNKVTWLYPIGFVVLFLIAILAPRSKEPDPPDLSVRSLRIVAVALALSTVGMMVVSILNVIQGVQAGPATDEPAAVHTLRLFKKFGFFLWISAFNLVNMRALRQMARYKEGWLKSGRPIPKRGRLFPRCYPELAHFATEGESLRTLRQITKKTHMSVRLIGYGMCVLLFVALLLLIRWAWAHHIPLPLPSLTRGEWGLAVCVSLLGALLIASATVFLILWLLRGRTRRGLRQVLSEQGIPICVECGYDLTGNVSGICPECGTDVPKEGGRGTSVGGLEGST